MSGTEHSSSYEPKPGSVAYRALAWLATQPEGAEFTASHIGEALGVDGTIISASLAGAVEKRAVFRRVRDRMYPRGPSCYSLVDHEGGRTRAAASPAAEPQAPSTTGANEFMPPPMAAPAKEQAPPEPNPQPATQAPETEHARAPVSGRKPPKAPPVASAVGPRVAIWSDGTLQIDMGGHVHTYAPAVGLVMLEYLELRQRAARAAGAPA